MSDVYVNPIPVPSWDTQLVERETHRNKETEYGEKVERDEKKIFQYLL